EAVLDLAAEHARAREQFGTPIGEFQAVQHLLARAYVQMSAIRDACAHVAGAAGSDAPQAATLLKALAGRNAAEGMQATLQVLGAIGSAQEHPHHRYRRRVMSLDALRGSAAALQVQLAAEAAAGGRLWRIPFEPAVSGSLA